MTACAATALEPGAARVMVTRQAAPEGCVFLGSVVGEQGGALTGAYTSNANLAEGALNDMKNKAHAMGANYVVLEDTQAGSTFNKGSGGQTDVTHVGNAFRCTQTPGTPRAPADTTTTSAPAPGPQSVIVVRAYSM